MSKHMPYYEWTFKKLLYRYSHIKCDCGWESYLTCSEHDCRRAAWTDEQFNKAEVSRADTIIAKLDDPDSVDPQSITILRGDFFEASGLIYPPGSVAVMKLSSDLMEQELLEGIAKQWAIDCPNVRLVLVENTPKIQFTTSEGQN